MITNEEHTQEVPIGQTMIQTAKDTDWEVLASKNLNFFVSLNHEHIPVENKTTRNESNTEEIITDLNFSNKLPFLTDYQTGIYY
jgi:hypothetical protein